MSGSSPVTAPPSPSGTRPAGRPGGGAPRVVAVAFAAVGALVLAGSCASAVAGTVDSAARTDVLLTERAGGVTAVDVDVAGGGVRVVAGDGPEAELDVRSTRGTWRLERDGGTLVVSSPPRSGVLQWRDQGTATLRLPAALLDGRLDVGVDLAGGTLEVAADLGALDVDVAGGSVELQGSVTALVADVTGGSLEADLVDVATADVSLTAGSLEAVLDGTPPDAVVVDVEAGSVDLALPPAAYDVRADATAGSVDDGLRSSRTAPRTVDVTTTAGSVLLREVPEP